MFASVEAKYACTSTVESEDEGWPEPASVELACQFVQCRLVIHQAIDVAHEFIHGFVARAILDRDLRSLDLQAFQPDAAGSHCKYPCAKVVCP